MPRWKPDGQRYITTATASSSCPATAAQVLLPLAFCRECGQEYYACPLAEDPEVAGDAFYPATLTTARDERRAGRLPVSSTPDDPWPDDTGEHIERLPEDWLETTRQHALKVKPAPTICPSRARRPGWRAGQTGRRPAFRHPAPFRFCLHCGVTYGAGQRSDIGKLTDSGSGGRSTATTILSLSPLASPAPGCSTCKPEARKLLSFTDNRQDASLQAGHFNDFVEIGLLRAALYQAVQKAGAEGIRHDELTQTRLRGLAAAASSSTPPTPKSSSRHEAETERALREVLGYRIYRDLKRGWRITSPNLEQCGLLEIGYALAGRTCARRGRCGQDCIPPWPTPRRQPRMQWPSRCWTSCAASWRSRWTTSTRLTRSSLKQQSSQHLNAPWAIDENEQTGRAASPLFPRAQARQAIQRRIVYLSGRGGFGQYLRRKHTFPDYGQKTQRLTTPRTIIQHLLQSPAMAGLVEIVDGAQGRRRRARLPDSGLRHDLEGGDGTQAFPRPDPRAAPAGRRAASTNPFFVEFYRDSRQPTARPAKPRAHRPGAVTRRAWSARSASARPSCRILYCSPTMELGVDIAELNAVNMRNVPPTPANYAQRSGRAGRSGQPALVFTYCTTGSPHDQYYFKRPELMVAGAVTPPRLDLANEDLVRAHVHAIWLAETGLALGNSLKELLDLSGDQPVARPAARRVKADLHRRRRPQAPMPRRDAPHPGRRSRTNWPQADWYSDDWLDDVLRPGVDQTSTRPASAGAACTGPPSSSARTQNKIIDDASRTPEDKQPGQAAAQEAESQIELLTDSEQHRAVGFLQLPLLRQRGLPARLQLPAPAALGLSSRPGAARSDSDEFLSRPRFLAISEFGPRTIIYHEGSRYIINKVILPVDAGSSSGLITPAPSSARSAATSTRHHRAQRLRPVRALRRAAGHAACTIVPPAERRRPSAGTASTRDEEERMRLGYELLTGVRFSARRHADRYAPGDGPWSSDGKPLLRLTYGQAATLWRINLGWRRAQDPLTCTASSWTPSAATGRRTSRPEDDPTTRCARSKRCDPLCRRPPQLPAVRAGDRRCRSK